MSLDAGIDFIFEKFPENPIEIIEVLLENGWSYNDNGHITYLPLGDDGDYDWKWADLESFIEVKKELGLKIINKEIIELVLSMNEIIITLLIDELNKRIGFYLNPLKDIVAQNNGIIDFNWHEEKLSPILSIKNTRVSFIEMYQNDSAGYFDINLIKKDNIIYHRIAKHSRVNNLHQFKLVNKLIKLELNNNNQEFDIKKAINEENKLSELDRIKVRKNIVFNLFKSQGFDIKFTKDFGSTAFSITIENKKKNFAFYAPQNISIEIIIEEVSINFKYYLNGVILSLEDSDYNQKEIFKVFEGDSKLKKYLNNLFIVENMEIFKY